MVNFIDFKIGGWKVGSVSDTSGVFAGENMQSYWQLTSKINQTIRPITGDYNVISNPAQRIEDMDIIDTWIVKKPPKSGGFQGKTSFKQKKNSTTSQWNL